ncbi:hypothetical protein V5799_028979 [Amblyomma americanum]|uniref:Uncharacterized protein n=1 Tax=Amblyomma americanum TaxID=6943 RepID=A0AAQ4ESI8_AMBAM
MELTARNAAFNAVTPERRVNAGVRFVDVDLTRTVPSGWASDAANVSHELPTLLPTFAIGDSVDVHTREFAQAAGSDGAQAPTQRVAQMLALTALDVLADADLFPRARKDLKEWKQSKQPPCTCPQ